jgi:hypothetical protein
MELLETVRSMGATLRGGVRGPGADGDSVATAASARVGYRIIS